MESKQITDQIENKIRWLESYRQQLDKAVPKMAEAERAMNVAMAVAIEKMLHGEEKVPVSVIERLAKRDCANEIYANTLAESQVKAIGKNMSAAESELTGLQTIFKRQDESGIGG